MSTTQSAATLFQLQQHDLDLERLLAEQQALANALQASTQLKKLRIEQARAQQELRAGLQAQKDAEWTLEELERRLRVSDVVLKFLTVRIDQSLKRLEKRKKDRDKRAARRATAGPSGAPPGPAQPSLAQQMTESPAILPGMPRAEG